MLGVMLVKLGIGWLGCMDCMLWILGGAIPG